MAETDPSYMQNVCLTPLSMRLVTGNLVCEEGIADMKDGALLVTTSGADGSVSVAQGGAFINGDDVPDQGVYSVYNDAPELVGPFAANSSGFGRVDAVIARVYDSTYGAPQNAFVLEIQQGSTQTAGTPTLANLNGAPGSATGTPAGPALVNDAIILAYVLIPNGFTASSTVGAGNIKDARGPYQACGGDYDPRVSLTASAVTSIGPGWTKVNLATTDYIDEEFFSVTASVVTILVAGVFNISGYGNHAGASTDRGVGISINGGDPNGNGIAHFQSVSTNFAAAPVVIGKLLSAGDTVQLQCYRGGGSDNTALPGRLLIMKVG